MKLIDLLVQELPKRGGWPKGVERISMFADGRIFTDKSFAPVGFKLPRCSDGWHRGMSEQYTNEVLRDQYESALAASKQVEWNGRGLPPVGAECEFFNGDRFDCRQSVPKDGAKVKIVAHEESEIGSECAVFTWTGTDGALHAEVCTARLFRPIRTESERTESERKRKEAVDFLMGYMHHAGRAEIELVYDAIAAGKIPGVKMED